MTPTEADPGLATLGLVLIVSAVFLFRFVWLYIPLSINVSPARYIKETSAPSFTFFLIGLWLVCYVPFIAGMQVTGGILLTIGGEEPMPLAEGALVLLRVVFDTLKNIVVTAGIAYALLEALSWKKK
jgi:hypothetical protein